MVLGKCIEDKVTSSHRLTRGEGRRRHVGAVSSSTVAQRLSGTRASVVAANLPHQVLVRILLSQWIMRACNHTISSIIYVVSSFGILLRIGATLHDV